MGISSTPKIITILVCVIAYQKPINDIGSELPNDFEMQIEIDSGDSIRPAPSIDTQIKEYILYDLGQIVEQYEYVELY